jgi:peroxiredoxin
MVTGRNNKEVTMALNVGDTAPDFALRGATGEEKMTFSLAEQRGRKNVVIAFFPAAFTPV